jgi:uncharacterized pyridoxamine 5'-phosphate oxidase family protein
MSEGLLALARSIVRSVPVSMLATLEGDQPRVRPVSPVRVDGFTVYVATLRRHAKAGQIALNPRVELCWLDGDRTQVRIAGVAEPVADPGLLGEIWRESAPLRRAAGAPGNPELVIFRVTPARVRLRRDGAAAYAELPPSGETGGRA